MTTTPLPHPALFPAFVGFGNRTLDAALAALPDYRQQEVAEARIATALQAAMGDLLKATQASLAHVGRVVDTAKADKDQAANLAAQAAKSAQAVNEALKLWRSWRRLPGSSHPSATTFCRRQPRRSPPT